mgnify:CR=1 FL=1
MLKQAENALTKKSLTYLLFGAISTIFWLDLGDFDLNSAVAIEYSRCQQCLAGTFDDPVQLSGFSSGNHASG